MVFGGLADKANFCTKGALSDILDMGHWGDLCIWLLTVAGAVIMNFIIWREG